MIKKTILSRALDLCKSKDGYHDYDKLFKCGDYVCASEGHFVLGVFSKDAPQDVTNTKTFRFSKEGFTYAGTLTHDNIMLYPSVPDMNVQFGETMIQWKFYDRVKLVMDFLAIDKMNVYWKSDGNGQILLDAGIEGKEHVFIFIMGLLKSGENVRAQIPVLNSEPLSPTPLHIDTKQATIFIKNYDEVQKRHVEQLKVQRLGNLFEVQIAMYASFYVEAANEEEAREWAHDHYDEVDDDIFDDADYNLEGVQGYAGVDDITDSDQIYTQDGWMDGDEYEDYLEEHGYEEEE